MVNNFFFPPNTSPPEPGVSVSSLLSGMCTRHDVNKTDFFFLRIDARVSQGMKPHHTLGLTDSISEHSLVSCGHCWLLCTLSGFRAASRVHCQCPWRRRCAGALWVGARGGGGGPRRLQAPRVWLERSRPRGSLLQLTHHGSFLLFKDSSWCLALSRSRTAPFLCPGRLRSPSP